MRGGSSNKSVLFEQQCITTLHNFKPSKNALEEDPATQAQNYLEITDWFGALSSAQI